MNDIQMEKPSLTTKDISELAAKKAETFRQLDELIKKFSQDTRNLKDAFESQLGELVRVGGTPYGWVDYSQGGDFEFFDEGIELAVTDRELIRVFHDGVDDDDPSFMIVVRVPELGEKRDVIFEDENIVFDDNPPQLES